MNQKQTPPVNFFGLRLWIALFLMVVLVPITTSLAQDEGEQRRLDAGRERIHEMLRQAEELQEAGHLDAAEKVRQGAHLTGQ